MLLNLVITNFAIIDRLEVEFGAGFNVLTGETGAGKSIVLEAFGLLLGDRARPDLVRTGTTEATVEALFSWEVSAQLEQTLRQAGLPCQDEGLVLRRVIQAGGRSRAYVNGSLVTLAQLQPLAEMLVAVCGQNEHQGLMRRANQLALLDRFGGLDDQLKSYRATFKTLQSVNREIEKLGQAKGDRLQRLDYLRFQKHEIETANISQDEEETLLSERLVLQNAERLITVTQQGYDSLYGQDRAVCEQLDQVALQLQELGKVDNEFDKFAETIRKAQFDIEDVAIQLRQRLGGMNFEPGRQEHVEARLDELTKLKRKFGCSLNDIIKYKGQLEREMSELENFEETCEALQIEQLELNKKISEQGQSLTKSRSEAADRLTTAVANELVDLAMPGARLEIKRSPLPEPGPDGTEMIEFLISPNPGEPLLPLARVVSGGELSRLMLALKRVTPGVDDVPTVIFDEVDAGIGGEAASSVGRKLHAVSASCQVLCVTHLPQVAAFADRHYRVIKQEVAGRTLADVSLLTGEERVREMARMLGGAKITEQTLLHARELIGA
ncbi:MAG: DNA repair protein RecN [Deltaproteobacteria bacterium]|jgi:DNA repair protein RecN (Recombination protein N)|nr:DNA repair protein RecN [Deltaproteobacteria bacterium]